MRLERSDIVGEEAISGGNGPGLQSRVKIESADEARVVNEVGGNLAACLKARPGRAGHEDFSAANAFFR